MKGIERGLISFIAVIVLCFNVDAQSQGFTPSSGVTQIDGNTFQIGGAALFSTTGMTFSLPFNLPPNRTIASLQGTLSYKSAVCSFSEALAWFRVDGKDYYRTITKLFPSSNSTNLFIDYSVPIAYTNGNVSLMVGSNQTCNTDLSAQNRTEWEFAGLLKLSSCTASGINRTVTICTPTDGSTVTSPVLVEAVVTDSSPVTLMQIYLDGVKVYEVASDRINTSLNIAPGSHRLTVQARDSAGSFNKPINITVQ